MEVMRSLQSSSSSVSWIGLRKEKGSSEVRDAVFFPGRWKDRNSVRLSGALLDVRMKFGQGKRRTGFVLKASCSCKDPAVTPDLKSKNFQTTDEEALILQEKAREVSPYLNGRCIFLVGMMGSGKSTVGKILSEALGYYFFDSDKLVEQAVGGASVAQIFKEHSEEFFRDNESKVIKDLSMMRRLVVATGGGAVVRPINWKYMRHGISVFLNVPLEALAKRIATVGTQSRPLLHQESGDAYAMALLRLSALSKERCGAYLVSDAIVSLKNIACKYGHGDVSALTPTAIAIEALVKINEFLNHQEGNGHLS